MVVMTSFPPPDSGIVHQEPSTSAYIKEKEYGVGTLYITESRVSWMSNSAEGFSLEYPSIAIHAVSRDTSHFPHPCLYLMLDSKLDDEELQTNEDGDDDDDDEADDSTEVRFVPSNPEHLDMMYQAMCSCQELHPDPDNDSGGDDYFGEECGDGPRLTPQGMNNLSRLERLLEQSNSANGHLSEPDILEDGNMETGQFEDAEDYEDGEEDEDEELNN